MITPDLKPEIQQLNDKLIALHKGLLTYQTKKAETQDNHKYNPYELLNKSLHDERFAWIRNLSQLISIIDENISPKNKEPFDLKKTIENVHALLDELDTEFSRNYSLALASDPRLSILEVDVRKTVTHLKSLLKPPSK